MLSISNGFFNGEWRLPNMDVFGAENHGKYNPGPLVEVRWDGNRLTKNDHLNICKNSNKTWTGNIKIMFFINHCNDHNDNNNKENYWTMHGRFIWIAPKIQNSPFSCGCPLPETILRPPVSVNLARAKAVGTPAKHTKVHNFISNRWLSNTIYYRPRTKYEGR